MTVKEYCPHCNMYHPNSGHCMRYWPPHASKHVELHQDIKVLLRNCDPAKMTFEDHLVWEKLNKEVGGI